MLASCNSSTIFEVIPLSKGQRFFRRGSNSISYHSHTFQAPTITKALVSSQPTLISTVFDGPHIATKVLSFESLLLIRLI